MFTTLCFSNDFSDFEGHKQVATSLAKKYLVQQQCMRVGTDCWSADENDYVNSAWREKRKFIF